MINAAETTSLASMASEQTLILSRKGREIKIRTQDAVFVESEIVGHLRTSVKAFECWSGSIIISEATHIQAGKCQIQVEPLLQELSTAVAFFPIFQEIHLPLVRNDKRIIYVMFPRLGWKLKGSPPGDFDVFCFILFDLLRNESRAEEEELVKVDKF